MRWNVAILLVAWALSVAAALAAPAPDYRAADWRLVRTFDPIPGPQRGNDFWVLEQDLAAAAKARGEARTARVLVRAREPGVWRVVTNRYFCEHGQVQALKTERFAPGARPAREPGEARHPIFPHGPDGAVYRLVCGDSKTDAPVVHGVDAAFAFEAQADAAFAAAHPPAG
ncbi:hypothetical protein [Caulobacter sp. 17J65-9]|uniref:hypothetical protein n=1 Tax=Caulobacter sp. 17J65-9 TaxID=2709382 RepID=UPI0013C695E7|nr:hypothetical protein [Caulobacter sp. 17J65-9]NEX94127.1 hypothetical protein [Caulobacter sp. 17J65-9]